MTSAKQETSKIGKRGVVVIPVQMRRRFGLEEGSLLFLGANNLSIST